MTYLILSTVNSAVLDCIPKPNGDCTVVTIDPITQANEVITFAGQPSTYSNLSIINVGFYNNYTLQYVPTALFTIFPNLQELDIINCGTTTLVTDAYANCNKLDTIILEGGNIPKVPAGIASTCTAVTYLSLGNNSIATIDANAFQGMTKLAILNLANNKLTCIPPTLFLNSKAYNSITIGENSITAIDSNIISGLPDLQIFDISVNLLTYLPLLNLAGTSTSTFTGTFSGNPINAINSNFMSIFASRPTTSDTTFFDLITCLPAGTTLLTITTSDYMTTSSALSTCFSNYKPATMSESAPCPPVTTTVAPTTIQDLICVTYPEWKEILKNFHLPQWKKRCPRFHRKKVCLHICFFIPGGDGDNDRDDRHTNVPGHTHKPDHPNTIRPIFNHRPGYPHLHKPGLHNPGLLSHIRPNKKPFKG